MKYECIIFDLDGTLLNTIADLTEAVNHALGQLHFPTRSKEEVLSFVGNGNRKLMERSVPAGTDEKTLEQAIQFFHAYYSRHYADQTKAYDKIPHLLKQLKTTGRTLAVISNKADYAVQDICKKYFPGIFDFVLGDREDIPRKPAPDAVYLALDRLGMTKEQTVYIGDSEVDIAIAANAGIDCISVDWGFRSHEALVKAGAKTILSDPMEILYHIHK